jgi:uncharacterized membrane protein
MEQDTEPRGPMKPGRDKRDVPEAAQKNLDLIADLEEEEQAKVGPLRRVIEMISSACGTPGYFVFVLAFIALWIVVNLWAKEAGWRYHDEPPFFWLQGLISTNALLLTISVLIRQDRMARLATHHAHLDLQINMLTEKKVTKALELIALLDEHQADHKLDNKDVAELSQPADPEALMDKIKRG